MDLPVSDRISVPGRTQEFGWLAVTFAYGTGTLSGRLFNTFGLATASPCLAYARLAAPTTPGRNLVWAVPRSLATTSGMISVPLGTEMFQFPRFPARDYVFIACYGPTLARDPWVSPFGHPRI